MSLRAKFRPILSDRLEERVVMSGYTGLAPALVHAEVVSTPLRNPKLGELGDSITDEYRFYAPDRSQAKNWVEILSATRHLRFGPYSLKSRGEPRDAGFAYNWARSDATSDDMVRNQLPGLANQVRRGQVNLVSILIGGNDFLHYASGFSPFAPPTLAEVQAGLANVEARAEDNLTTAVRTIMAASPNVKMAIGTLPDIRTFPAVAVAAGYPTLAPLVNALGPVIDKYNARVKALAAEQPGQITVVDLNAEYAALAAASAATGKLQVGNQTFDARTPSDDPHHIFLADGIHIGTVGQGLIANQFVQAYNSAFGTNIRPLRPQEILRQAKIR
jgi:lysophospholipase L1-like esterase